MNTASSYFVVFCQQLLQCQHLIPALNAYAARHNTQPHTQLRDSVLGMDDLTTDCSFDLQATWVIDIFDIF